MAKREIFDDSHDSLPCSDESVCATAPVASPESTVSIATPAGASIIPLDTDGKPSGSLIELRAITDAAGKASISLVRRAVPAGLVATPTDSPPTPSPPSPPIKESYRHLTDSVAADLASPPLGSGSVIVGGLPSSPLPSRPSEPLLCRKCGAELCRHTGDTIILDGATIGKPTKLVCASCRATCRWNPGMPLAS